MSMDKVKRDGEALIAAGAGDEEEDDVVPPGFRFHPTDEELVTFYLRRKVARKPLSMEIIKEMDIYKHDPTRTEANPVLRSLPSMLSSQIPGAPLEIVAMRKDINEEMEQSNLLGNFLSDEEQLCHGIPDSFSEAQVIGRGFGVVYMGILENGEEVDVKRRLRYCFDKFDDSFSCLKSISPKNIYDMAMRLSSSVWTIVCGTDWISASRKSDSPKMGTISEFDTMNYIGWRKEPTENQSHHSDPDSSRAEHGIKAVGRKTPAAWVVATGAPHHATGDRGLLSDFITEHNDQFVHAADGVPMKVLARGAVVTDAVVLPDVWLVPELTANLVSVGQLIELGYSLRFVCRECCISAAGKVVGKARLQEGGLYVLDFLKVPLAI